MRIDRLSQTNPLRGLDLEGLVNHFEMGERGYYADVMWLFRYVLRRNGVARAVRRKLTAALGRLDWNIKIPDNVDGARKAMAERQRYWLRGEYDAIENLADAIVHLAMADIMGFAHLNKVYAGEGANDPWRVVELRVVEQWFLCRDGLFAPWCYNPTAAVTNRGEPLVPRDWIWREVDDPAAEIFAQAHIKMSTADEDWDQYSDTYAVPPIFAEMPADVRRENMEDYQRMVEAVVSDMRGSHPYGARVYSLTSGTDGVSVFAERLRYYREEIVLAGTGGILTTLDGNTGIGKGPSEEHGDTWLDVAAAIGAAISQTLQRGFDGPALARHFPGEEALAYFALDKPEHDRDASDVLGDAKLAREAGYRIAAAELSEKSGYQLTDDTAGLKQQATEESPENRAKANAETPTAAEPPADTPLPRVIESTPADSAAGEANPALVQTALAANLDLEARWLAPVAETLNEIEALLTDESIPIEEVRSRIEEAAREMPELLGKLDVDALAEALENASGFAAYQGLADGLRAKTRKTP